MSLILFEGFEDDFELNSESGFVGSGIGSYIKASAARNGDRGFESQFNSVYCNFPFTPFGEGDTLIFGFAFKMIDSSSREMIRLQSASDSNVFSLGVSAGNLVIRGGSSFSSYTAPPTTPSSISTGVWYYVECKLVLSATGGDGSVEIHLDGAVEATWTSVDNVDDSAVNNLRLGQESNTNDYNADDLYILDATGSAPFNDFLGDVKVVRLDPTGAGNYSDGVGSDGNSIDNHLLVDDGVNALATDYVELGTVGDRESYTTATLAAGEVPLAVKVQAALSEGDAAEKYDGFLRIGTTDYEANDQRDGSAGLTYRNWYFDTNPATSSAWAEDDLDGVEFGVKREA